MSVDYRLAPETRFPGNIEDCYAGLSRLFRHTDELGVDRILFLEENIEYARRLMRAGALFEYRAQRAEVSARS